MTAHKHWDYVLLMTKVIFEEFDPTFDDRGDVVTLLIRDGIFFSSFFSKRNRTSDESSNGLREYISGCYCSTHLAIIPMAY